jgi:hypothetical protein
MSDIVGQIRQCAQDLGRDDEETKIFFWHCGILREAANEIVSLRKELDESRERNLLANERADNAVADAAKARDTALEEAAREAETSPVNFEGRDIAAFIRAIKDKQP